MPPRTMSGSCRPSTAARDCQPCRSGSNTPSSRGGGSAGSGPGPVRSLPPAGRGAARRGGRPPGLGRPPGRCDPCRPPGRGRPPGPRAARRTRQPDQPVLALDQFGGDVLQRPPRVPQRQAGPLRQVPIGGRGMPGQITAGQPAQVGVRIGRNGRRAQPVPGQHVGVLLADHGPAHRDPPQRRQEQQEHQRLPLRPDPGGLQPAGELRAAQRAVAGEEPLDQPGRAVGLRRCDALLGETPGAACLQLWRGEPVQRPVVLAAHQVQGAAIQPADHQGAVHRERVIDVRGGQSLAAHADGQPGAARILTLDGQQPLGDLLGPARGRPGQQLSGGPFGRDRGLARSPHGGASRGS